MTLKQEIDNLEKFDYTNRTAAAYGIYNASRYQIAYDETDVVGDAGTAKGAEVANFAQLIKQGALDYTRTFKFDEKGNLIPENNTAQ